MTTKRCSRCKLEKPLDAFHINRQSKDGRQTRCRSCRSTRGKLAPIVPLPNEEWRDIPGYEGLYHISNHGRIQRVAGGGGTRLGQLRKLTLNKAIGGYLLVALNNADRKTVLHRVHMLVAAAFIGPRPGNYHVHHMDGDPVNNHVANLMYIEPGEHTKLERSKNGIKYTNANLTEDDVRRIRQRHAMGDISIRALGREYNVAHETIRKVVHGLTWAWVE